VAGSNPRRNFLRYVMRDGARAAFQVADALRTGRDTAVRAFVEPLRAQPQPVLAETPWPWASASCRPSVTSDLTGLAYTAGLEDHLDSIKSLARISFRLTPSLEPRRVRGREAGHAIGVRLGPGEAALAEMDGPGTFRFDLDHHVRAEIAKSFAIFEDAVGDTGAWAFGQALELSPEWVLPRGWSARVEALGLTSEEQERWESLRLALAVAQGVDPPDSTARTHRLGRLFGYPDDRSGAMHAICEAQSRNQASAALSDAELAMRWTLLLQIPLPLREPQLKCNTAFIWVRQESLRAMNLSDLVTIVW
jgi:hypothetical protein